MGAARSGDIGTLYQLIGEDEGVLRRIKKREFMDTPLHIASAAGKTDFAMEMMYLQPSFATKLNKDGLSPLHLAFQNGHTRLALSLLKINKSLVSVKGKMGYTPLHYLVMKETDGRLLTTFLNDYPRCIQDVTSRDETALHVAAHHNPRALKVLLRWLTKTSKCSKWQKQGILNFKNRDKETVLHVAVSNDQPEPEFLQYILHFYIFVLLMQIIRLLTDLRIDTKVKNSKSSTALDILNGRTQEDSINIEKCVDILHHPYGLKASARKIRWVLRELLSQLAYEITHMSVERGSALLVVTVLILTATYQSALSPPGGVLPASAESNDQKFSGLQVYLGSKNTSHHIVEKIEFKGNNTAGSSVLTTQNFLWFFIPNMVAFSTSFLITCFVLLTIVSGFFSFVLALSLLTLLFCFLDSSLIIVSPNNQSSRILLRCVYFLAYASCLGIVPIVIPKLRRFFRQE
ncbi:ankyrin repeat-containing protein BDA1-like [Durio zibethinus]|uniref:Ankyrin repeat-containing protein BDA1-like n=1 Tax=Durio zibethinus TaxID=66656 RepID=A0A6P6B654_DURZI|nr:ankyrin repeat-containing protein BDA1-like [Durio zibethinus]